MFRKLLAQIKGGLGEREPFDPSTIDDPLARQVSWTPARGGGASFRTHNLVAVDANRLEFHASNGAKFFYLLFLIVGLGVLIGFSFFMFNSGGISFKLNTVMPMLIGLVFALAGGSMFYFGVAPVVFDKRSGYFWKGRKAPDHVFDKSTIKHFAKLEEIHSLQLISEYCRGKDNSYYSYELNLVLVGGTRINVVDHGKASALREDAATLSSFLGKPVWDAITVERV